MNKMRLSEPIMIKIRNKMMLNFREYEDEISKTINPKVSNLIIDLLKTLEKKLDSEYKSIRGKIASVQSSESIESSKINKPSLSTKLSLYFDGKSIPVKKKIKKVRKTGLQSKYLKASIKTFLRSGKH